MNRSICSMILFLWSCISFHSTLVAGEPLKSFQPDKTIVFLGDSNTFSGGYVAMLEAALLASDPKADWQLLNLGVPSETASGLSEPDHPFPRPCIHERIDRTLELLKPDLVFVCYGMNDGIYHPFSAERQAAYEDGIGRLVKKVHGAGAEVILLTPPPFESEPLKKAGKLGPSKENRFAYFAPFADYDSVLEKMSIFLTRQASDNQKVIDIHSAIHEFQKQQRATNPEYNLSGDGIHFGGDGHRVIAETILSDLRPELKDSVSKLSPELVQQVQKRQELLRNSYLKAAGWNRPELPDGLPIDQAKEQAAELRKRTVDSLEKK